MQLLSDAERSDFVQRGLIGGYSLLTYEECQAIIQESKEMPAGEWSKGLHLRRGPSLAAGLKETLVRRVADILGENLLLWGCQVVSQSPGKFHRWHVDVEAQEWPCVNAWVALENVTPLSTLSVVEGSHRFAFTPQELARETGLDLNDFSSVVNVAKQRDNESTVAIVDLSPGEFVLFDGRCWHASRNDSSKLRSSLLLQYSPPHADIRRPLSFDPPICWHEEKPSCILASGRDSYGLNKVVGG
jgi:ectoine hydroxylase-related dioxygenase (phytanoyl-CoA dioxygenase family)